MLSRRLTPLNGERLRLLEGFEEKAEKAGRELPLEDVLHALIAPAVKMSRETDAGKNFIRLIGRMFAEPSESVQAMLKSRFELLFFKFSQAFRLALPGVKKKDYFWRLHFVLGAMSLTLCDSQRPALWSEGVCKPEDVEEVVGQLVAFCAAGMRAESAKKRRIR